MDEIYTEQLQADMKRWLNDESEEAIFPQKQGLNKEIAHCDAHIKLHEERERKADVLRGGMCTSWTTRFTEAQIAEMDELFQSDAISASDVTKERNKARAIIPGIDPLTLHEFDIEFDKYYDDSVKACSVFGKWVANYRDEFD